MYSLENNVEGVNRLILLIQFIIITGSYQKFFPFPV